MNGIQPKRYTTEISTIVLENCISVSSRSMFLNCAIRRAPGRIMFVTDTRRFLFLNSSQMTVMLQNRTTVAGRPPRTA